MIMSVSSSSLTHAELRAMLSESEHNGIARDSTINSQQEVINRLHAQVAELSAAILDKHSMASLDIAARLALAESRVKRQKQARRIKALEQLVAQQSAFIATGWLKRADEEEGDIVINRNSKHTTT